jgi:hypothetical protein
MSLVDLGYEYGIFGEKLSLIDGKLIKKHTSDILAILSP